MGVALSCSLGAAACYLLFLLTCALLMTSAHSEGPLWDAPHANALHMGATEFSAYAALEMKYIAEFHTILGNSSGAAYWAHRSNVTTQAIHDLMWDEVDEFYYYYSSDTKTFVKVQTPCGFTPLLLPGVPDDRVVALIKHLNDPKKFASKVPLPTVAMDYVTDACPASSTNMWRRPAWVRGKYCNSLNVPGCPDGVLRTGAWHSVHAPSRDNHRHLC